MPPGKVRLSIVFPNRKYAPQGYRLATENRSLNHSAPWGLTGTLDHDITDLMVLFRTRSGLEVPQVGPPRRGHPHRGSRPHLHAPDRRPPGARSAPLNLEKRPAGGASIDQPAADRVVEGYCDTIARSGSFPEAEGRRLLATGRGDASPSFRYFLHRQMVTYLIDDRHLSFAQVVARAGAGATVEAELRQAFAASN